MPTVNCRPPCLPNPAIDIPGRIPPCGFYACDPIAEAGPVNFELNYNFFEGADANEVMATYITDLPFTVEPNWPLSIGEATNATDGGIDIKDDSDTVVGRILFTDNVVTFTGPGGSFAAGDSIRLVAPTALVFDQLVVTLVLQRPLSFVNP